MSLSSGVHYCCVECRKGDHGKCRGYCYQWSPPPECECGCHDLKWIEEIVEKIAIRIVEKMKEK